MRTFRAAWWCVLGVVMIVQAAAGGGAESLKVRNIVGHGANRQVALADAFRNAISQALGTYVVTSRTWDGETLDKKIFDNSDAVVKNYKVVSEGEKCGKWIVAIDAEIVRNEMMKYIRRDVTTKVGEGELANLLAKRTSIQNAVKSLDLLFQNWRENVYRVEKYGSISIASNDDVGNDVVRLSVPFIITFRWEAYGIFMDKVRNVLSRIAIGKTQGEIDFRQERDFMVRNGNFYCDVGLTRLNDSGELVKTRNPNGYGEIRIVSTLSDDRYRYEIYIVPNQVKQALDQQLSRDAEIRFSFMSKGGECIASQSYSCEIYSFGWEWPCDDRISLGFSRSSDMQLITFMDSIYSPFSYCWSTRQLYHASVPVPLASATRISDCGITVCPPGESETLRGHGNISNELMPEDEWNRINRKSAPQTSKPKPSAPAPNKPSAPAPAVVTPPPLVGISLSEKDAKLKQQTLKLCQLPCDMSTASKWFALADDFESGELQQMAFRASALALLGNQKLDTYQSKVHGKIKDVGAFENGLHVNCPSCGGRKVKDQKCSSCKGSGACKFGNCRGGQQLVRSFRETGGDRYETCRKCGGSGTCTVCGGRGSKSVKCYRCNGRGRVISIDAANKAYKQLIEQISRVYR